MTKRYLLPNGAYLSLSKEADDVIRRFRQKGFIECEAGGILLGRFIQESSNIVIDQVTVPFNNDVCRRGYFHRQDQKHQQIINDIWLQSHGTCNYLGEWHTHPQVIPNPSDLDLSEWRRKAKDDSYPGTFLIFIIVGTRHMNAWCILDKGKIIKELNPVGQS